MCIRDSTWPEDKFDGPEFELSSAAEDIENFASATEDFILDKAEVPQKERKWFKGRCLNLIPKMQALTTSVRDYTEPKNKSPESMDSIRSRLYASLHSLYKEAHKIHLTKWARVCPKRADPPNISQQSISWEKRGQKIFQTAPQTGPPGYPFRRRNCGKRKTGGPLGVQLGGALKTSPGWC